MSFDDSAATLATRLRATGQGFLTIRRDELRDHFGIGRLTEGQSQAITVALRKQEVIAIPHPFSSGPTLRLYDGQHPIGDMVQAIVWPDEIPETPLRRASDAFSRQNAGRDLRSDDVPWPMAFDLFLQVALGRELDDWEELRDDRHPTELARAFAQALGFPPELADEPSTLRIAAAACAIRPRRRNWVAAEFVPEGEPASSAQGLLDALGTALRRQKDEHERVLQQAARLLLGSTEIPHHPVELGLLGLRYRRENSARTEP